MRSCWCLLGRCWLSSRLICCRRFRTLCLVLISDTVIWDVCSIDQSVSTRGKVVGFASNIVFRRVIHGKALLLEVVSHKCGTLVCCQCERATIDLCFKYALCRGHIAHTSSQFRDSSRAGLLGRPQRIISLGAGRGTYDKVSRGKTPQSQKVQACRETTSTNSQFSGADKYFSLPQQTLF
jgi:hypothetical protein